MAATGKAGRRESSGGADRILAAAIQLFSAKGFAGVSMSELAKRAQVSKANIYHHFGSKKTLYLAALKNACEQTMGLLSDSHYAEGAPPFEDSQSFFASQLEALLERPEAAHFISRAIAESDDVAGKELAEEVLDGYFRRLVAMIDDGRLRGKLRAAVDPALVAFVLVGANVFFFENRSVIAHIRDAAFAGDPAGYARGVFDLLLRGMVKGQQDLPDCVVETDGVGGLAPETKA